MDKTRDPSLDENFFFAKCDEFFRVNNIPEPTTPEEVIGVIASGDPLVDIFSSQLSAEGVTYSSELILQMGSALGRAFLFLFAGDWKYSPAQERWVVSFMFPNGEHMEVNIFNKLEKRFQNGSEDSISYFYDMVRNLYWEKAEATSDKPKN